MRITVRPSSAGFEFRVNGRQGSRVVFRWFALAGGGHSESGIERAVVASGSGWTSVPTHRRPYEVGITALVTNGEAEVAVEEDTDDSERSLPLIPEATLGLSAQELMEMSAGPNGDLAVGASTTPVGSSEEDDEPPDPYYGS